MQRIESDPTYWGTAAALLSLDLVLPLHPAMGLTLQDPTAFVSVLREVIVKNREEFQSNPSVIPPLRDRWMGEVAAYFGPEASSDLRRWILKIFECVPGDHPERQAWQSTFMLAGRSREKWSTLGLPAELEASSYAAYVESRKRDDIDSLIDSTLSKPLTVWDLEMCSIHHWDPSDDEGGGPLGIVYNVVINQRFDQFWRGLLDRLGAAQLQALWTAARDLRSRSGLDPSLLASPRMPNGAEL